VGFGIAAAIPIQVVATSPPAAAVIFAEYNHDALNFVLSYDRRY
jgi:hypothetical protein